MDTLTTITPAAPDFDAIENERIKADIIELLGPHGSIETYQDERDTGTTGWTVFDGALSILRADMPVGSIVEEEPTIAEHRQSLLLTIAQAFVAGRASVGRAA